MKFVHFTVTRETKGTRFVYPPSFNAQEIEHKKTGIHLYAENILQGGLLLRFDDDTFVARRYINQPGVSILPKPQADAWIATNRASDPEEETTDPNRMLAILAKSAASIALSTEDLDALDPDKPERGINRRRKRVEDYFSG